METTTTRLKSDVEGYYVYDDGELCDICGFNDAAYEESGSGRLVCNSCIGAEAGLDSEGYEVMMNIVRNYRPENDVKLD